MQLQQLVSNYPDSQIVISYRNKGIPTIEEISNMLRQVRPSDGVLVIDLGLYSYALNKSNDTNNEFLIISTNH